MIRVHKPVEAPEVLVERGSRAAEELRRSFDVEPLSYTSGEKTLPIASGIYGHVTVIEALKVAQHRKCCFCERKLLGDVEHFRPKKGYRQRKGDSLVRPGYYWLAYEWSNLFLACGPCNQRFKRDLFPLADPSTRASSHHDDIAREMPLMLHPEHDLPEEHIGFRSEVAFARRNSRRGNATIAILGLNHPEVIESRRGVLKILRTLRDGRNVLVELMRQIQSRGERVPEEISNQVSKDDQALRDATADTSEFAAMARCLLE